MRIAEIINKLEVDYLRIDNGPKQCRLFYDKKHLLNATKGGGYWELIHDLFLLPYRNLTMNKPAELLEEFEKFKLEYAKPNSDIDIGEVYNFAWKLADSLRDHISSMGEPKVGLPEKLTRKTAPPDQFVMVDTVNQIIDYLTQRGSDV